MSYHVHLSESDQIDFVQALLWSLECKQEVIRDPAKFRQTRQQYSDAAEKFLEPVTIHRASNNLFTWMEDQIRHSPGLRETDLGQRVIATCTAARLNRYQPPQPPPSNITQLFDFR
jgi:hypothetical protein